MKRALWIAAALAAIGVVVAVASALDSGDPVATRRAPTSRVVRGSFKPDVWTTGELKATRVVSLAVPSAGGGLRLIRLVETGTPVEAGDVVMEFDNVETIKRAVEINSGISILPLAVIAQELSNGTLKSVSFDDPKFVRPTAIIIRKGRAISKSARYLLELLQNHWI